MTEQVSGALGRVGDSYSSVQAKHKTPPYARSVLMHGTVKIGKMYYFVGWLLQKAKL